MTARNQTFAFFALAYAVSWAAWVPLALAGASASSPLLGLISLGSFGPSLAAILLTALFEGRAGLRRLLGGLLRWRAGGGWYAAALLGPFAVAFVAAALTAFLLGGPPLGFGGSQIPEGMPAPLVALLVVPAFVVGLAFGGPLGEEIGWRGYALPRMQEERGALPSALVLGVVWALWHLPLFFVAGTTQSFLPFLPFAVWVVSLSVVFAWAYNGSGGSLLVCLLLHGAVNFCAGALAVLPARTDASALPFYVYAGLVLLTAGAIAAATKRRLASGGDF